MTTDILNVTADGHARNSAEREPRLMDASRGASAMPEVVAAGRSRRRPSDACDGVTVRFVTERRTVTALENVSLTAASRAAS